MKKIYMLVIATLTCITSCRQDKIMAPSEDYSSDFTVTEAKSYFTKFVLTSTKKTDNITVSGAGNKKFKKSAQWDMVLTKRVNQRNIIVTPLITDENVSILDKKTGKAIPVMNIISMISYKDNKGAIHAEVVKRIPDDYSELHPKVFNGLIIIEDWDGNFIKGFRFLDGKITKLSYSGNDKNQGYSTSMLVEVCEKVGYRVCAAGSCGSWGYDTYCKNVDNGAPDDPQDPSGGGGYYGGDNNTGVPGISDYPTFYDQVSAEANFVANINTNNLPPCFKDVLDDIMELSTNGNVTGMIYKFSQTIPGYKWKLESGAISSTTVNAFTSKARLTNTVTTTFDVAKYVDASDLGIARLILHEAVHAYMVAYYNKPSPNATTSYSSLIIDYLDEHGSTSETQHDFMTDKLKDDIAAALKEYGDSKNYGYELSYYKDLAWGGLDGTSAYGALIKTEKDRIGHTFIVEQYAGLATSTYPVKGASTACTGN